MRESKERPKERILSEIRAVSVAEQFIEVCVHFENAHGYKPKKAVMGRKMYEQLLNEVGPLPYEGKYAERGVFFNGVKLEVVG